MKLGNWKYLWNICLEWIELDSPWLMSWLTRIMFKGSGESNLNSGFSNNLCSSPFLEGYWLLVLALLIHAQHLTYKYDHLNEVIKFIFLSVIQLGNVHLSQNRLNSSYFFFFRLWLKWNLLYRTLYTCFFFFFYENCIQVLSGLDRQFWTLCCGWYVGILDVYHDLIPFTILS